MGEGQGEGKRKMAVLTSKNEQGFTLIEVLIASIILTIGLLELMKLQIVSINHTQAAQNRTIANNQLQNMVQLLRSNIPKSAFTSEIAQWNTSNKALLPQGHGEVEKTQEGYRVTIAWNERDAAQASPQPIVISQTLTKIF